MTSLYLLAVTESETGAIVATVALAAVVLALLAVVMGWVLGWANKTFHVEVDPKVEAVSNALPGANCGGCGYVGCSEYAEAVAVGKAEVTLCGPGGVSCVEALGNIMGVTVGASFPYRAVVHCSANFDQRLQRTDYTGEQTCSAANLVSGVQGCTYGCLGIGDCVTACEYDAIHMKHGLPVVDHDACIGCKACAQACPRNVISMVPFKADRVLVVACSNEDMGPDVKAVCETGCIGCKACTKGDEPVVMEGNLPVFDYDDWDGEMDLIPVLDKCRMESLVLVGTPTAADIAAVEDEELPEPVKADFDTTVDDAEWRG